MSDICRGAKAAVYLCRGNACFARFTAENHVEIVADCKGEYKGYAKGKEGQQGFVGKAVSEIVMGLHLVSVRLSLGLG